MKTTTLSCLLAALCSATYVLADARSAPEPAAIAESDSPAATPSPELVDEQTPKIEIRQGAAVADPAATLGPSQYPIATTQWIESTAAGAPGGITYVSVVYTQTFASVPDQWYTAGTGTIGYGTLTKEKRDVVPRQTGIAGSPVGVAAYAQPIVMEVQEVVITQPLQAVEEVLVLQTIAILPNITAYPGIGGNGTGFGNYTHGNFTHYNSTLSNLTHPNTPYPNITSPTNTTSNGTSFGNMTTNATSHEIHSSPLPYGWYTSSLAAAAAASSASLTPPRAYNRSRIWGAFFD